MKKFNEVKEEHIEKLELFVPIVKRVHGGEHPEFNDVARLFDEINEKIKVGENPEISQEFQELRQVTSNYTIPNDVCESYEAVYNMLEELDQAYSS